MRNQNVVCAIDVETTGLEPGIHEAIELCVLPLDDKFIPSTTIPKFSMNIRCMKPETVTPGALQVNGYTMEQIVAFEHTPAQVVDLWWQWKLEHLGSARIEPLAHNWAFDKGFIQDLLKSSPTVSFDKLFHYQCRDSQATANFLNDRTWVKFGKELFPGVSLIKVAARLGVPVLNEHKAYGDCLMTAQIYKIMMES